MAEHLLVLLSASLPGRLEGPRTHPLPLGLLLPSAAQEVWQVGNEGESGGAEGKDGGESGGAEGKDGGERAYAGVRASVVARGEGDGEIWGGETLEVRDGRV